MPHPNTPWVRDGAVLNGAGKRIRIDSVAWFRWLASVTTFCYSCRRSFYRLTVRREQRRGRSYWYGYSKNDGKLHNVYLGKSQQLTEACLEQACLDIAAKAKREVLMKD